MELNFVFLQRKMYTDTSTEQKNGKEKCLEIQGIFMVQPI